MKIIIWLCVLVVLSHTLEVPQITDQELEEEMNAGKYFWLVYRTSNHPFIKVTHETLMLSNRSTMPSMASLKW